MNRPLRWYDTITINAYYTGLTTLSQTMSSLVVPLLVQQFVGVEQQGSAYGRIRLWTLMVALLVQALMGLLSDRNTSRWGRRRPFIMIGTLADLVFITSIGFSAGMEGWGGYTFLFIMLVLLMISTNTAHGAVQGLIPDLIPENTRGVYSGFKALLEVPIPLILVSFTIGRMIAAGDLWSGLIVMMIILVISMIITMFTPEIPLTEAPAPLNWQPFLRLASMTALFTGLILLIGFVVRQISSLFLLMSTASQAVGMSIMGFISMALLITIGVYLSVILSVGSAAKDNPSFTWWVVNRLAFLVGSTNLASFAVYYLQGRLGLEREQAAAPASQLILFVGISILILALPGGWLADRFGHKKLVWISGLIATMGTLIIIVTPNLIVIYIGAVFVGAATGIFYTANWALGTDLVPQDEAGRYLGISNLAGAGAGAVGAYIGGPIADFFTSHYPESPGLGYIILFIIYGALFLFSTVTLSWVHVNQNGKMV